MTTLGFDTYLDHLTTESRRFRDVLADCDPSARVPTCPEWDASDLLWHLAGVQRFWARIVAQRPASPQEVGEFDDRPESYAALLAAFDHHSEELRRALSEADPAETAWTWSTEQTVGFSFRRQAHEALIHRLDAELTAGVEPAPRDPRLCADGVLELLEVMYGGCPPWGTFSGGQEFLRLEATDTTDAFWVQLGRFTGTDPSTEKSYDELDLHVVDAPADHREPHVVVRGTIADLDAWLWHRSYDSVVTIEGERDVYDRFRAIVDTPLT